MWTGWGEEEDASIKSTNMFIYDQIRFLKLEHSDYIIANF